MDAKLAVWSSYYVDLSPEEAVLEMKKHCIQYSEGGQTFDGASYCG